MQEDIPSNSNILNSSSSCNKGQMVILCKRFQGKTQKHLEVLGDSYMELLIAHASLCNLVDCMLFSPTEKLRF